MKKKILIIDDDVVLLNTLLAKLTVDKYDVRGVTKGKGSLEEIKKWKPNLVILDLILPDIYGLEILTKLRNDPSTKALPVVICTNQDDAEDHKKCKELGVKELLLKVHFSLDQLVEKIEEEIKKIG